jgi:lipid-A-disaccharide synthase
MLLKKPMVVAYKMSAFSYAMISRLLKVPYVSLPNLLADECLVPELMQDNATVENLGNALLAALTDISRTEVLKARFAELHQDLRRNASESAAKAILELLQKPAKVNP